MQLANAVNARQIAYDSDGLGPYSRPHRLRNLDCRTALGKYIRTFEAALIEHAGGQLPFAVRVLIDQVVGLEVQLMLLERAGVRTDHDRRCYASWLNAKRNLLKAIGLKAAADEKPKPTLKAALETKPDAKPKSGRHRPVRTIVDLVNPP
jgi:hypothetical protein